MIYQVLLLVIGLVLLIIASNKFVDAASSLADGFKVPKMIIALTIASFCTCLPELAISFNSILNTSYDITIANVLGSCIVNILLIIGVASIIKPIRIKSTTVSKELPLLVITTVAFVLLFLDKVLSRLDAFILLLLFTVFCFYLLKLAKRFKKLNESPPKYSKLKSIIITFITLGVILIASDLVVNSSVYLSNELNIPAKLISMVVIVIGTSLPELTITITSAKKGEFDMTVGNIIGTNIFNICIVLGLPTLLLGTISSQAFNYIDLIVLLVSSSLFFLLGKTEKKITRLEGILMVLTFIAYYSYLFIV